MARAEPPSLELPVACTPGRDCVVQNYVDRDPGPGFADFTCGFLSYDGHKGTDFRPFDPRLPVAVLAAAAGTVKARRDGMPDRVATGAEAKGSECGNGVLLEHGRGWQTQYCHMARGSIAVRPGQSVAAGEPLGRIGLSGQTEFHHLHFEVRYDGAIVDPFLGPGAPAGCGIAAQPLWAKPMPYRAQAVLGLGFAAQPPTPAALEAGQHRADRLPADSPNLLFWALVMGVRANDRERLTLFAPDGTMLTTVDRVASPRNRAQWLGYAGTRGQGRWPAGSYRGEYRLTRDGAELLSGAAQVIIEP